MIQGFKVPCPAIRRHRIGERSLDRVGKNWPARTQPDRRTGRLRQSKLAQDPRRRGSRLLHAIRDADSLVGRPSQLEPS
jgi:hypothetical protein